jgi:dTDP-4-dehydrorhamnose reductase
MKILLTGATGLLGSTLARTLAEKNHTVIVFEDDLRADISDTYHEHYDWVIHAAAMTDVAACEKDRSACFEINALGVKKMRDLAKEGGAKFLYISTASVFSGEEGNYKESDLPYPKNYYNISKYAGELLASEYEKSVIVRLNLIGVHPDGSRGKNFMEWLVDSLHGKKDINAFDDVFVNPLSNWTVAQFIEEIIANAPKQQILHIASSDVLSKANIVELVAKRFPKYSGTITRKRAASLSDSVPRPSQMWLNCDETKKKLNMEMPEIEAEITTILNNAPFTSLQKE